jgi:sugar lactone lactonase YvrE
MTDRARKILSCAAALVFAPMSQAEKNSDHASTVAVTIDENDLFPEGLVYDGGENCFYIGSLLKHKILKVDFAGHKTDLIATGQDGLFEVLGLKVDPQRRTLWACSAVESENKQFDGYSAIFEYDLTTRKLRQKFLLDNRDGPHLFNDIAITRSGDAFFTDSRGGAVLRFKTGKTGLTPSSRPRLSFTQTESRFHPTRRFFLLRTQTVSIA